MDKLVLTGGLLEQSDRNFRVCTGVKTEFISTEDPQWKLFLRQCPHDFYHLPEYTRLAAKHEGGKGGALLLQDADSALLLPLILRSVPGYLDAPPDWCDGFSPYGYSCPLLINPSSSNVLSNFKRPLLEAARSQRIVSVFVRLHPLLGSPDVDWARMGEVVRHGNVIYIDLSLGYEQIFSKMRKNHRRDIARLRKLGFRVVINAWQYLDDFVTLYSQAMQRKAAEDRYCFSRDYFEELRDINNNNVSLFAVLAPDQTLVSANIVIMGDKIISYHMGATSSDHREYSPSKLFFDELIQWAGQSGYQCLMLGGGVGAKNDSLYHYKAGFSPLAAQFRTLRMIADKEKFDVLVGRWQELQIPFEGHDLTHFPPYYIR